MLIIKSLLYFNFSTLSLLYAMPLRALLDEKEEGLQVPEPPAVATSTEQMLLLRHGRVIFLFSFYFMLKYVQSCTKTNIIVSKHTYHIDISESDMSISTSLLLPPKPHLVR